jgi:hypothetical protein
MMSAPGRSQSARGSLSRLRERVGVPQAGEGKVPPEVGL